MKKFLFCVLFCFTSVYLYGQDFFMYVNGQKRTYEVSATKILVNSDVFDGQGG